MPLKHHMMTTVRSERSDSPINPLKKHRSRADKTERREKHFQLQVVRQQYQTSSKLHTDRIKLNGELPTRECLTTQHQLSIHWPKG